MTHSTAAQPESAYRRQMGAEYGQLHPEIQRRFDFSTVNNVAFVGKGVMEKIWNGNRLAVVILKLLSRTHILFPKAGTNIAFEIHNYPYIDEFNREVHSMNRVFHFPGKEQRFDGTATYSESRRQIVEYLGLDHRMAFRMELKAENGAIRFSSGKQYAFIAGLKLPVPSFLRGEIDLLEWFDDKDGRFYLDLKVRSRLFGPLFGFNGWFDGAYLDFKGQALQEKFRPTRVERKD